MPPALRELLLSLGILGASYLAARLASALLGALVERVARRTQTTLDEQLLSALKRPFTSVLFLGGAFVAVDRLPLPEPAASRLVVAFVVAGVALVALGLVRIWGVLVHWYTTEVHTAEEGLATEFGPLVSKLGKLFIVVVAAITALRQLGVDVASLVVSLGVGSLAVGLAAQPTLANMFAGLTLLTDRPFRIGDRIQLASGELGDVQAIGLRATRIRTLDDTVLVIPNSALVGEKLVNLSQPGREIVVRIDVAVAYGSDLAAARRILAAAPLLSPHADPGFEPVVVVTRFADFAVNLRLAFRARDYRVAHLAVSDVHEQIHRGLAEAGIEIPFPVRRLIQEAAPAAAGGAAGER